MFLAYLVQNDQMQTDGKEVAATLCLHRGMGLTYPLDLIHDSTFQLSSRSRSFMHHSFHSRLSKRRTEKRRLIGGYLADAC